MGDAEKYETSSVADTSPFIVNIFSLSPSAATRRRSGGRHLVHLQVDVGGLGLAVCWGVVSVGGVVLPAATLLQVGLQLLTAPPAGQGEKSTREKEKKGSGVKGWIIISLVDTRIAA